MILEPEVEAWVLALDDDTYDRVAAAITRLAEDGPALGRPLVDQIKGSRHHNMKELRVRTCRILFAFDPSTSSDPARRRRQARPLERLVSSRHRDRRRSLRPVAG